MFAKKLSRRDLLKLSAIGAAGTVLAACQPQVVEKIVKETVVVEKEKQVQVEVTKVVEKEVQKEVTKVVEKVITQAPQPKAKAASEVAMMMWGGELSDDEIKQYNTDHAPYKLSRLDPDQVRYFAMLAAGNPPDIYRLQAPEVPGLLARGIPLDLTPYFETSMVLKIDDLAAANNFYKGNSPLDIGTGKIWGMVKDWSPDCTIWVNKLVFQKAGLTPPPDDKPITYDQVFEFAQKLTKKEGDRILIWGLGVEWGWVERFWEVWLEAIGKSLFSNDFSKFQLQGNEDAVKCAKWHFDLAKNNNVQNPLSPSPRGWIGPDFLAGQIAMCQYGFWYSGMVTGTANTETGMEGENKGQAIMIPAPLWTDKGKRISTTITATGSICSRITKDPDATWDVFQWYNGQEPAVTRAKGGWGVPGLKSFYPMIPEYNEERKQVKRVLMEEIKNSEWVVRFNPFLKGGEPAAVGASWATYFERTLKGEFSFEQMIGNIQKEIDVAIKEGMDRIL